MTDEKIQEVRSNPEKALCYFSKKLAFSLGPVELKELSSERNIKIIDVRGKADYEIGHIPQALSIPYEELSETIKELNKDDLHIVYSYDAFCHLAVKAGFLLAQNGFSVMELCGGFKIWSEEYRFATTTD